MKSRIRIQIVPSRSGRTWTVLVNGWPIIRHTDQPLAEIAARLIGAGHKPHRPIWQTRTPILGPCRMASTLGAAAAAESGDPFRAPDWAPVQSNGAAK